MRNEHPYRDWLLLIIGITQLKAQILAHICVQVQFSLFRQLHDSKDSKHLRYRGNAETTVTGKRLALGRLLLIDDSLSLEIAIYFLPIPKDAEIPAGYVLRKMVTTDLWANFSATSISVFPEEAAEAPLPLRIIRPVFMRSLP